MYISSCFVGLAMHVYVILSNVRIGARSLGPLAFFIIHLFPPFVTFLSCFCLRPLLTLISLIFFLHNRLYISHAGSMHINVNVN